ncbi:hypothetical protein NDU88_003894 [Pleurodeles waltl]|uniref:Uncharacterized protein n=1 Tax=Pleurodeles waltl TaxID=8319 RepID=A0AAV7W8T6_PLEWA|nr:hypothetical protein NDU88_003894 [Pleurodeles waltl]
MTRGPLHPDTSAEPGAPKPPPSKQSTGAPASLQEEVGPAAQTSGPQSITQKKGGGEGPRPDNDRQRSPPNTTHRSALQRGPQVSPPVTSSISRVQEQPAPLQTGPALRIGPAATWPPPPARTLRSRGRPKLTRGVRGPKRPPRDPPRNRPPSAPLQRDKKPLPAARADERQPTQPGRPLLQARPRLSPLHVSPPREHPQRS